MKRFLVFFWLVLVSFIAKAGFDYTPVLLHLSKVNQHDSVGFNLVDALPKLLYRKIMNNEVTLWDSPNKKAKITPDALIAIERSTSTSFSSIEDLFLNEIWRATKKDAEFNLIGFTFINENSVGSKVVYGFIDADENRELLKSLVIPTNANSQCNLTYWDALTSKVYNFNIVQFGRNNFEKNMQASLELKHSLFDNNRLHTNAYDIKAQKELQYYMLPGNDKNKAFFESLEAFFNANREMFYSLGGERIIDFYDIRKPVKISKIELTELRSKNANTFESIYLKMIIYVDGKPLDELNEKKIKSLPVIVNFRTISDYLSLRNYEVTLTKINNQEISSILSTFYLNALDKSPWDKITMSKLTD